VCVGVRVCARAQLVAELPPNLEVLDRTYPKLKVDPRTTTRCSRSSPTTSTRAGWARRSQRFTSPRRCPAVAPPQCRTGPMRGALTDGRRSSRVASAVPLGAVTYPTALRGPTVPLHLACFVFGCGGQKGGDAAWDGPAPPRFQGNEDLPCLIFLFVISQLPKFTCAVRTAWPHARSPRRWPAWPEPAAASGTRRGSRMQPWRLRRLQSFAAQACSGRRKKSRQRARKQNWVY
jgi:hypothetical protein